jgi:hypothetical protein
MSSLSRLAATQLLAVAIEDEEEAEEEELLLMAAAVSVVGAEQARLDHNARRNLNRGYLTRPTLLPDPREGTPWTALYASQNDRAFITTMGFDIATFDLIIRSGFGARWYEEPLPRPDAPGSAAPRPSHQSLDAAGALGLTLHYLNSTMREISLQEIFALIPSTVSRYITHSLDILLKVLQQMPDAKIIWPSLDEKFNHYNSLITQRHPRLLGAFASIDGLSLLVQESQDQDIENATYNGWTSTHNINSVLVYSPEGRPSPTTVLCNFFLFVPVGDIIACHLNCPGSWHDARVALPIYAKLRDNTPDGYYLVSDTAFPKGTQDINGHIISPLKSRNWITGTESEIEEALAYNCELLSYRQTAEWGNRSLQGSFGRLRIPLEIGNADRRGNLMEICVRLHNLRCRRVGINQIQEVYKPCWTSTAHDQMVWDNFKDVLFSDQRNLDHVSRFHIHVVYND